MKTGFLIALVGIFSVFAAALYSSTHPGQTLNLELLAILGGILAAFGFLLMQFNGTRSRISKTQKMIGLLFGAMGVASVIFFVVAPVGMVFFLCFTVLLFALVFSGIAIPEPLM